MSGDPVRFTGNQMASVIEAVITAGELLGEEPVVIGGLAVVARLSTPYRATVDLDILDGR